MGIICCTAIDYKFESTNISSTLAHSDIPTGGRTALLCLP